MFSLRLFVFSLSLYRAHRTRLVSDVKIVPSTSANSSQRTQSISVIKINYSERAQKYVGLHLKFLLFLSNFNQKLERVDKFCLKKYRI